MKIRSLGFTLIELLVIIAIVGVMAGAVVVAVNPLSKLNSAKLANVKTFSASVENALIMSQVGKWSFDDSEIPGKDTSGYGNDGTLVGATRVDPAECGLGFKGCLNFDGVGDYVNVGNGASLAPADVFTVEAWVYRTKDVCTENSPCPIWSNCGDTIGCGGDVIAARDGGIWIYIYINDWQSIRAGSIPLNAWTHIAATYNGSVLKGYINGALIGEVSVPKDDEGRNGILRGLTPIWIGRKGGDHAGYWGGLIDEVKIYNKALLSYQIQQLYARGLAKHLLALK